jgi:hypothetical protein
LSILIQRLENIISFHLQETSPDQEPETAVNRDYAAETKNEARKKHIMRSLRVSAETNIRQAKNLVSADLRNHEFSDGKTKIRLAVAKSKQDREDRN